MVQGVGSLGPTSTSMTLQQSRWTRLHAPIAFLPYKALHSELNTADLDLWVLLVSQLVVIVQGRLDPAR